MSTEKPHGDGRRRDPGPLSDSWTTAKQSTALYFDYLPEPAWLKDDAGRFLYANDAAENAFGLGRSEIYGRTDEEIFTPETASINVRHVNRVLATGEAVESIDELELRGQRRQFLSVRFPIRGSRTLVGGLLLDINAQLAIERELRDAVIRKRQFLATVAHEMRNPLAPITSAVQILDYQGGHPPDVQRLLDVIKRQSKLLAHLVDDLMDASRIARGKLSVKLVDADLQAVLREALEISRPHIDARRHAIRCSFPDEPLRVRADPRRLGQVFSNLLNNAAKFTREGGEIRFEARRVVDRVEVVVADNGVGIDAKVLPHIFDLFAQGHSHEEAQGGLGVGLALVKRIVELHGGSVEAHSEGIGRGARFVVRLPLLTDADR